MQSVEAMGINRGGLARYYGERAKKQAVSGNPNNATYFARAAAHHGFVIAGRFSNYFRRDRFERLGVFAWTTHQLRERPTAVRGKQEPKRFGHCHCEMA